MLLFDEPDAALTERFHAKVVPDDSVKAHPLLQRWRRVAKLGVRPDERVFTAGTTNVELVERRERLEAVIRGESSFFEPIAEEFASRDMIAILADPEGIILAVSGGGRFSNDARNVRLREGECWSEAIRGTNAIGTTIVEGCAVALVGRAHYEQRNSGIFCFATPIRDPYNELACVLDVSGPVQGHDPAIGIAVRAAGAAVQQMMRSNAFRAVGGWSLFERLVERCATPALLVEASGSVTIVNEAARGKLQLAMSNQALRCEGLFGVDFPALHSLARNGRGGRFETLRGSFEVRLDRVPGPGDRTLAVLVNLEPIPDRVYSSPRRAPGLPTATSPAFAGILGSDPQLLNAKATAQRFAATDLPVLLLAETGTGKELFARAIHAASRRATRAFVAVNCGAVSASLLESELFGHAPGAFTGASSRGAKGLIKTADGGTLFLDEIADTSSTFQAALLRVLDDGVYYRVGDAQPLRADFRLICATCGDLPRLVEQGTFRKDLFYRIHGARITIPALAKRTDRVTLARSLLELASADAGREPPELDETAVAWIERHPWPGNVRELKSAINHALALVEGGELRREHFPEPVVFSEKEEERPAAHTRDEIVRQAVLDAVDASRGNVSEAARRLGMARSTVYRILRGSPRR